MINFRNKSESWILRQGDSEVNTHEDENHNLDSLVEIGSITKTVTAKLINSLSQQNVLNICDPIEEWLESTRGHSGINISHLIEHLSGLPTNPPGVNRFSRDPYANFTDQKLNGILQDISCITKHKPDTQFE
jgi:CubicO group peptidase (beta-lactamase class C family)